VRSHGATRRGVESTAGHDGGGEGELAHGDGMSSSGGLRGIVPGELYLGRQAIVRWNARNQPPIWNLRSVFTLVPLPCGCHVTRDSRAPGGMNRDSVLTQAFVVTAGSRDRCRFRLASLGFESPSRPIFGRHWSGGGAACRRVGASASQRRACPNLHHSERNSRLPKFGAPYGIKRSTTDHTGTSETLTRQKDLKGASFMVFSDPSDECLTCPDLR
jgi:hypothetical protein